MGRNVSGFMASSRSKNGRQASEPKDFLVGRRHARPGGKSGARVPNQREYPNVWHRAMIKFFSESVRVDSICLPCRLDSRSERVLKGAQTSARADSSTGMRSPIGRLTQRGPGGLGITFDGLLTWPFLQPKDKHCDDDANWTIPIVLLMLCESSVNEILI